MSKTSHAGPGDKELMKLGSSSPTHHKSPDHALVKSKGGGHGGAGKKTQDDRARSAHEQAAKEDDATPEMIKANTPGPETTKTKPKAVLKKIDWVKSETQFNTDAEVSAEFEIPDSEKDRTLVDFQLLENMDGEYVIRERAQGHVDAAGRATTSFSIKKGDKPESTFALKAKHCSADDFGSPRADRVVTETATISFEHTQVSGLHFPKNSSFIGDESLETLCELKKTYLDWKKTHDKAQIIVFGHAEADQDGEPHPVSKSRAQSAFLFIIGDVDGWAALAEKERWGVWEQQCMLRALGHFDKKVKPTGTRGPKTRAATEKFFAFLEKDRGKKFNPMLGFTESYIRKELYREYMNVKRSEIELPSSAFRLVSGFPYVGCSGFNRYMGGTELHDENRRVVFEILQDNPNFPMDFPCRSGSVGPCEDECKKAGDRAIQGFRCKFYDEMVKQEKVGQVVTSGDAQEITEDFAIFASTIYGEAAASSEAAWRCIAHVIMNRVGNLEWRKKKTPSEVISWRGFDAFTFKNHPYTKCNEYLTGKRNGSEKRIERMVEVITPIYQRKEMDLTGGCTLYFSPQAQAQLHEEQPKKYSKSVPADWDFSLLEEADIHELLPTDDFKFYRYK